MLHLLLYLASVPLSLAQRSCTPTSNDVLGPFFEENGLTSFDIAPPYELGKDDQLVVEGRIRDSGCNPVVGATVEVWYAGGGKPEGCNCINYISSAGFGNCRKFSPALGGNICYVELPSNCTDKIESQSDEGLYKSARACNDRTPDYTFPSTSDTLWYRGKMTTNQNGEYSYRGTFPAVYEARPIRHIHYKITDNNRGVELVTQLYFKDFVPPSYEDYVRGRDTQFPTRWGRISVGRKAVFDVVME